MASTSKADKKDEFTMVRIRRSVLELARSRSSQVDRSIANYIEHLVKEDSRDHGILTDRS